MLTTIPVIAGLNEHNQAEFIADTAEILEPNLIAETGGFKLLEELGVYWLYRRRLEHCPPSLELLGVIPTRHDLLSLFDLLGRAVQETDPLTRRELVIV